MDSNKIKEQKLLAHDRFYWLMELDDAEKVIKKCARSEMLIKKFYHFLIKSYDKAFQKEKKVGKGFRFIKNYLLKKLKREGYEEQGLYKEIEAADDEGLFNIIDRDEILEFLKNDLIVVETIEGKEE